MKLSSAEVWQVEPLCTILDEAAADLQSNNPELIQEADSTLTTLRATVDAHAQWEADHAHNVVPTDMSEVDTRTVAERSTFSLVEYVPVAGGRRWHVEPNWLSRNSVFCGNVAIKTRSSLPIDFAHCLASNTTVSIG